jgi:hypothetical protein
MGRGRQKAKHTKVARELKYFSPDTNYGALQRELTHHDQAGPTVSPEELAKWSEYDRTEYQKAELDRAEYADSYESDDADEFVEDESPTR